MDFRQLAGFRNALVHGCLDVNPKIVHRVLNAQLDRFVEFARQVDAWLKTR